MQSSLRNSRVGSVRLSRNVPHGRRELIDLVERTDLPVRVTLRQLGISCGAQQGELIRAAGRRSSEGHCRDRHTLGRCTRSQFGIRAR